MNGDTGPPPAQRGTPGVGQCPDDAHPGDINIISERIIGAAMAVHRALGPGLLESAYQACLATEFEHRRLAFEREVAVPLLYRGRRIDCSYRLDLLVEGRVIVEVKAVAKLDPIFTAQMLTNLRATGHRLGLIINFTVPLLKQGIRRLVI